MGYRFILCQRLRLVRYLEVHVLLILLMLMMILLMVLMLMMVLHDDDLSISSYFKKATALR